MGTSSCLFTVYNETGSYIWTAPISPINAAWTTVNTTFPSQPEQQLDIAAYPNPFQGLNAGTFLDSDQTQLRLIDGGEAGENNPLASLIVKARELEVIIVVDASADINNMPNGQALIASADRSTLFPSGTQSIPPLPKSPATFIAQGLNTRPTFFGCGGSPPLVHGVPQNSTYPLVVFLLEYCKNKLTNTFLHKFENFLELSSTFQITIQLSLPILQLLNLFIHQLQSS